MLSVPSIADLLKKRGISLRIIETFKTSSRCAETLKGVSAILEGTYDEWEESAFYMIGALPDVNTVTSASPQQTEAVA